MKKYIQAYLDAFGSGLINDETIKQHIEQQAIIDKFLPDSASFFYIVESPSYKYHFLGKQQQSVTGYSNEEFLDKGVELFLDCLHPEEVEIILGQVYPEAMEAVANIGQEQINRTVIQYNYRFKMKSGEYINLMERVYVLRTDTSFKPTLLLGNVINIDSEFVIPMRLSVKVFKHSEISETILSKSYTKSDSLVKNITTREMDILRGLAIGKTSKEIGEALYISHHTVDTHRRNLLAKLKCKSVVELSRFAFKNGLL